MTFEEACKLPTSGKMYEAFGFEHILSICFYCKHLKICPVSQHTDYHDKDEAITRCNFYEEE